MEIVASIGGGISSTVMLPFRLILEGNNNFRMVTALLPNEHPDLFRLEDEISRLTGINIENVGLWKRGDAVEKDPIWSFFESGMLGNSRFDPCSRMLKREPIKKYIVNNFNPATTKLALGITGNEIDRSMAIRKNWKETGFETIFPIEDMYWSRQEQIDFCQAMVGFVPALYLMGFAHNNCSGACIKAGMYQWAKLLYFLPDVYEKWEDGEERWRAKFGNHTILRRTINGKCHYITLKEFRQEMQYKWSGMLPGFLPYEKVLAFESLPLDDLDDTPSCTFCDAMA